MTVTLRVMSAGDGYRYLLNSVAVGDGYKAPTESLIRYYEEKGTPPGRWLGSGLPGVAAGAIAPTDDVTETQLRRLLGAGEDPLTGEPLGRRYRRYSGAGVAPVAGFDLTMSAPKSVSVLWAVADAGTQALITRAHHATVADILDLLEREIAMTRIGTNGIAQVEIRGVLATAYDHYDSRASDPHLHTHVVIANRVQALRDGRWRTLDSRALHHALVALSETYHAILADRLTRVLGVAWQSRDRGRDRNAAWEIAAVPEDLVQSFSTRARAIDAEVERLIEAWAETHGRAPTRTQIIRLRQQATLTTRPAKELHSMAELTERWRRQAGRVLGRDALGWSAEVLVGAADRRALRVDDLDPVALDGLAEAVVSRVADRRSTWRRWNLHAEAARQTMGYRFASTTDREAVLGLIVDRALDRSLRLTPPEIAPTPVAYLRSDGSGAFRPRHAELFSSTSLLDAEDRLLRRAEVLSAPTLEVARIARAERPGRRLGSDQVDALRSIAVSGRVIDVMVGPAGTGKTTTLGVLRRAWEREHGRGSVVGLAPSAAAAEVLAGELGIPAENTAKWLHELGAGRTVVPHGGLVILDEASLAGTIALDRIAAQVEECEAKLLLVGDWAQLASVEAGGAFGALVRARDLAPELFDVRRFSSAWEREASRGLRLGDEDVLETYAEHGRVDGAELDAALDSSYRAWRADTVAGRDSILIAPTVEVTSLLNERARADLVADGRVDDRGAVLHDGSCAGRGDRIVTRSNDRRLSTAGGWVKNGDRWHVLALHRDGSLTVRRAAGRRRGTVTLPAPYVAAHVELGYATTVHRAQGATVDTAHAVVTGEGMSRETLYVALTRGRDANHAYVITDAPHLEGHQSGADGAAPLQILRSIVRRVGAELTARETIVAEQDRLSSIAQLAAEYETLAQDAQRERWTTLLETSGIRDDILDSVLASDALGTLVATLRRAEANGHDIDRMLPRVVAERPLDDADDVAAVLEHRVARATVGPGSARRRRTGFVAELVPRAEGVMPPDFGEALAARADAMEARVRALARDAIEARAPWLGTLGPQRGGRAWARAVRITSAYRDRYGITSATRPLGESPVDARDWTELVDRQRATAAIRAAQADAHSRGETPAPAAAPSVSGPGV